MEDENGSPEIELSDAARNRLDTNLKFYWWAGVVICGFLALIAYNTPLVVGVIMAAAIVAFIVLCVKEYHGDVARMKKTNADDYALSLKIREVGQWLETATAETIVTAGVTEDQVGEEWKPFRVEYFPSSRLTGEIRGSWSGFLFGGSIHATLDGNSTPNLVDSSSMLFLQNGSGETLRVLVPGKDVATSAFSQLVHVYIKKLELASHAWLASLGLYLGSKPVSDSLRNDFLDNICAACELPPEERPTVKVRGSLVQAGVVLATAIEYKDAYHVLVPTGYFKLVSEKLASVTPQLESGPPVTAALPAGAEPVSLAK